MTQMNTDEGKGEKQKQNLLDRGLHHAAMTTLLMALLYFSVY